MIKQFHGFLLVAAGVCAALCVLPGRVEATAYYVTPTGAGDYGGTNWHNAFSNVQAAASLATNAGGDTIFLQWGVYSNAAQIVISNTPNLILRGGCNGLSGGNSNEYSGTNSTLTRTGGVMRIVYGHVSTVTVSGVTISGGCFTNGTNNGAGLFFTNCAVTLTNCVVRDNTNTCSAGLHGGGLYAAGGSLTVLDSSFYNNSLRSASGGLNGYGGGIAAVNCPLVARGSGSMFSNNSVYMSEVGFGGAIFATNSALTIEDAVFVGNWVNCWYSNRGVGGGAVFQWGSGLSATIARCRFETNSCGTLWSYGGAVYLGGATGVVANCLFTNNYSNGSGETFAGYGGGIYATGLQLLQVISNEFRNNWAIKHGGALYVNVCSSTVVDRCTMDASGLAAGTAPEQVYMDGCGRAWFLNSTMQSNQAGRGLCFAGGAGSVMTLTNCQIKGNNGNGFNFSGGAGSVLGMTHCMVLDNEANGLLFTNGNVSLFNCLLAQNVSDGLLVSAGTATVSNCTLADNGGWGFNLSAGTGAVVNSIAWGNGSGGFASNANLGVNYSCSQSAPSGGGVGNLVGIDPQFVNAPGYYYLAVNGLTNQVTNSPCIDAGSNTPGFWGLDTRTTRTDGTNDTNAVVDLGYHYTNGLDASHILPPAPTVCYVDAANGTNTNNGLTWGAAWKTLTKALATVAQNATIHVAAGAYNAANGETFPLTVQKANLSIIASNAVPALTVLDNGGTAGANVFSASGKGIVAVQGLTFKGGCFTSGEHNGAGLCFLNCAATLTNCVVRDNTNTCSAGLHGGGLYAAGGSLTVLDSSFYNNSLRSASGGLNGYGGGLAAVNCPLVARGSGSMFSNNSVYMSEVGFGGAIYATNSALTIEDAVFVGNWVDCTSGANRGVDGGAVFQWGSGLSAAITRCRFEANSARTWWGYGGAVYLGGATGVVANCLFTNNYSNGSGETFAGYGGGIYATGLQLLQVISNEFRNNWAVKHGGALYVNVCSSTVVDRCTMDASGLAAGTAPEQVYVSGGIIARFLNCTTLQNNNAGRGLYFTGASSMLALTNCLVVNNKGDGLVIASGTAAVVNCTLANNVGWGIARPTSAGLTVKNSILWGNSYGGIGHNQNLTLTYTDTQDSWAAGVGAGNISADPLFVDPAGGDFHEQGVEGSWRDGGWAPDDRNSPCLDAGDPASDWSQEPKPCGNRINLGAYGNTPEATRSLPKVGTVLRVW